MKYNGRCEDNRWVAGAGTTITAGIGTAIAAANALGNGNGIGGLFGGGGNKVQELMAENAMLKSEKSTDEKLLARDNQYKADLERFYGRFEVVAGELATLKSEQNCLQKQLTDYAVHQKEIDELQRALIRRDIDCLAGKVETMGTVIKGRIDSLDALIGSFTETVIPKSAICDTKKCGPFAPQQ